MSNFKVLTILDLETILAFEDLRRPADLNEIENMTYGWKAPWRQEALEHYLKTGWCIGLRDENEVLLGYFLAQPFLFMESYTQTLWVEYIAHSSLNVFSLLIDFAYKYGRDKHLQRVLFQHNDAFDKVALPFKAMSLNKNFIEVYTTKMG